MRFKSWLAVFWTFMWLGIAMYTMAVFKSEGGWRLRDGRILASAVTTTSSTTSTTSTSLEPLGLNMIWGPVDGEPLDVSSNSGMPVGNNALLCTEWTPSLGISGADRLGLTMGGGSGSYAIAIYNYDGTTEIVEGLMGNSFFAPVTDLTTSPTSFNIDPGTQYRVCVCATDAANTNYISFQTDTFHPWDNTGRWANLYATKFGVAANSCTSGDPPSTTGALTPPSFACTSNTCDGGFPVTSFDQVNTCSTANPSSWCDATFPLFAVGGPTP